MKFLSEMACLNMKIRYSMQNDIFKKSTLTITNSKMYGNINMLYSRH